MAARKPVLPLQSLVVYAKHKARLSAFYRRTLGLEPLEEAPTHDLLAGPGLEVVVHAIPPRIAKTLKITRPPQVREDGAVKPVFTVPDLAAVRAAAKATGGHLAGDEAAWTWRGALVLDGWDPEGNVVQFRQRR